MGIGCFGNTGQKYQALRYQSVDVFCRRIAFDSRILVCLTNVILMLKVSGNLIDFSDDYSSVLSEFLVG